MQRLLFTHDHERFRGVVRKFFDEEVTPGYADWRREGRPPRSFWKGAARAGILGISVPEQWGGLPGSTFRHSAIVSEEAQRAGLALGGVRVHTDICMPYLLRFGSTEQISTWAPRLTAGDAVVALALSEPGAGSDLKAMHTKAIRDGDSYVVNGSKTFISNGAAADLIVLAVKTDPAAGREGISLLLVDAATEGFTRGRKLNKLGLPTQDLAELSFTDMRIPASCLLGEEGAGFGYLTSNLAQERLSIAVSAQAAAVAVLDTTIDALPGNCGQSAKFAVADSRAEVVAGQALADAAILALEDHRLSAADAALAKLFCTEMQGRVTQRCVDLLGTAGLRPDSFVGQSLLDGRVTRIFGGSSEIMKVIVAQSLSL